LDFTLKRYFLLLKTLKENDFCFQTLEEFIKKPFKKVIVLRHDVDLKPGNALQLAKIEYELGIKSSYYFRVTPKSLDVNIIRQIMDCDHEIGYHYESLAALKNKRSYSDRSEMVAAAYEEFKRSLAYFRTLYDVKTICMHGSPLSRYDSRDIWKNYSYKDLGIIGDLFYDIDYSNVLYISDTGRCWDGESISIRDKSSILHSDSVGSIQKLNKQYHYKKTREIITAIQKDLFPSQCIINTHPQRWNNKIIPWLGELGFQNVKNIIKYLIIKCQKYDRISY
jgi:hypothetical protein